MNITKACAALVATIVMVAATSAATTSAAASPASSSSNSSSSQGTASPHARNHDPDFQGSQLVTFGDSYTANPSTLHGILRSLGLNPRDIAPLKSMVHPVEIGASGCRQDSKNWPRILAENTNRSLADYSCNGATSRDAVIKQVDRAIASGDIGPVTEEVVILVGGLDISIYNPEPNAVLSTYDNIASQYTHRMQIAAGKVRHAAPGAEITVASYPSVVSNDDRLCMVNIIPNAPLGIPIPGLKKAEGDLANMQRSAAEKIGARFVDIRQKTRGHDTCAPDKKRYISGQIDVTSPAYSQFLHPTLPGSYAMARIIGER